MKMYTETKLYTFNIIILFKDFGRSFYIHLKKSEIKKVGHQAFHIVLNLKIEIRIYNTGRCLLCIVP